MFLWSRAGKCRSEVTGICAARCESSLNSSTRVFVHISSTGHPVPCDRTACRCLDGTWNEESARQGGVVWFCFEVWGIIFIPCADRWWHGTTILVPGWNPGISEIKEAFPLTSVEPGFPPRTCFSAIFFQVRKCGNAGNDVNYCHLVNFPTKIKKSGWTKLTDLQICLDSWVASMGFHCSFLLGKLYTFCGYLESWYQIYFNEIWTQGGRISKSKLFILLG